MKSTEYLKLLFRDGEGVCVGSKYDTAVSSDIEVSSRTPFYSINPLDPNEDHEEGREGRGRRSDINVTSFRNFMFEMDKDSLETQLQILSQTGIKFTAIVYSGGKSYHAIIALEEALDLTPHEHDSIQAYKRIWKQIAALINSVAGTEIVDPSGKNPSRFTRLPGSIRKNGKEQKLIEFNGLMSMEDFEELLSRCPAIYTPVIEKKSKMPEGIEIGNKMEFYQWCPQGLELLLKYPSWVGIEGNYPNLFRLALWAIDSTGVEKDIFLNVLEERVFPAFQKCGYPRHRWNTAVDHAYNMKGGSK